MAILLVFTIPAPNAEISPKLERKEESNSTNNQESENAIEADSNSNEEKLSLLKESKALNGMENTDEALFKNEVGYVNDSKSISCYDSLYIGSC